MFDGALKDLGNIKINNGSANNLKYVDYVNRFQIQGTDSDSNQP
jgi:hypothetical protein